MRSCKPEATKQCSQKTLEDVIRKNPHCRQLLAEAAKPFVGSCLSPRKLCEDGDRFLSHTWKRMPYKWRSDEERSSCHWGQLKLMEQELKCLSEFCISETLQEKGPQKIGRPLVLYVGAAPGRHLPCLARRFPGFDFELYDPADFDDRLWDFSTSAEAGDKVKVHQCFFDDAAAKRYARIGRKRPLIFFCDIRTTDEKSMNDKEIESAVEQDMMRQQSWVEMLQPTLSLLKFRLPWGPGTTRYLQGKVMVQAFPPCTSTETRLLVSKHDLASEKAAYDHEEYMERLMHHNTVGRAQLFHQQVPMSGPTAVEGLDHCYDCAALTLTVRRYLALINACGASEVDAEAVAAEINKIISEITHSGRTLATQYHVSSSRHIGRQFDKRKYVDAAGRDHFSAVKSWSNGWTSDSYDAGSKRKRRRDIGSG
eukprot:TRINITY_DN3964_c0_g1_i1.p1 TRINITY_DN3964_c0_g1~~TRINITY_DN3964_c0_g1_i1.p1  ORF type:complete len:424 (-),score=56.10 TRINITY_DN3964_c0_g1_i1:10-1281(-)